MAVQLIQPLQNQIPGAINSLADSFGDLARMNQERQKQAADNLLQRQKLQMEQEAQQRQEEREKRLEARQSAQEEHASRKEAGEEHLRIRQLYQQDPALAASYLRTIGAKNVAVEPVFDGGAPPPAAGSPPPTPMAPGAAAPPSGSSPHPPPRAGPRRAPRALQVRPRCRRFRRPSRRRCRPF